MSDQNSDISGARYAIGDHPAFQKVLDHKDQFVDPLEKHIIQRDRALAYEAALQEHSKELIMMFREYGDVWFDRLRDDYRNGDISHAYECLVQIQHTLVETLEDTYIKHRGHLSLKQLLSHLKHQRKIIRKLDIDLHTQPIIKSHGELAAYQTLYGAMAHALFEHQLRQEPDYTVLEHDVHLDKLYQCDILAYHTPTNTYVAIDVTTTAHEPQQISGAQHHEDLIRYLIQQQIVDQTHYQNGATLTHLVINPLRKLGNQYHVLVDDKPQKHQQYIDTVLQHSHDLIQGDYGFPQR